MNDAISPATQLAMAMVAKPGAVAVLLGSGISSAAGIPTGYEITAALLKRLATAERAKPKDSFEWYRKRTGRVPQYSDLLEALGNTPAERQNLLAPFFVPSDAERIDGLKLPTPAHRALAELMRRGLVRVVITTNFDRLLEHALADLGVEATVLATDDAIAGAEPLTHLSNVIIKVNGDYLDSRIRNTVGELSIYPQQTLDLLIRVFDEFSLLVCGWSGEWDLALRGALERAAGRRYTTFWMTRSDPSSYANDLIVLRQAKVVRISDANSAIKDLNESCLALERDQLLDKVTPHIAALTAKRWLQQPRHDIDLHDLLMRSVNEVASAYSSGVLSQATPPPTDAAFNERLSTMESLVSLTLNVASILAAWGSQKEVVLICRAITDLVAASKLRDIRRYTLWQTIANYPAALLWNACAAVAYSFENAATLGELFRFTIRFGKNDWPASRRLSVWNILCNERSRLQPYGERYFGETDRFIDVISPVMNRELFLNDPRGAVLTFEYILALCLSRNDDGSITQVAIRNEGTRWSIISDGLLREIQNKGDNWVMVRAGIFQSASAASEAVQTFEDLLKKETPHRFGRMESDEEWEK